MADLVHGEPDREAMTTEQWRATANEYIARGEELSDKGDDEGARDLYYKAIELWPPVALRALPTELTLADEQHGTHIDPSTRSKLKTWIESPVKHG